MQNLMNAVDKYRQLILDAERYIWQHPETGFKEYETTAYMAQAFKNKVPTSAPLLLYTGAVAYDVAQEKLVFMQEIQMDMWETVKKCMELFPDMTVEVQAVDAHYRFTENPAWDAFSERQNCAHGFAQPGDDLGDFLKFTLYGQFRSPVLADMCTGSPEEIARIDEALKRIDDLTDRRNVTNVTAEPEVTVEPAPTADEPDFVIVEE